MNTINEQDQLLSENQNLSDEEILGIVGLCGHVADNATRNDLEEIENDLKELLDILNGLVPEKDDDSDVEEICEDEEWIDLEGYQENNFIHKPKTTLLKDRKSGEINNSFLPLIKNIVEDFGKLEVLNNETSKVVERIKNITKCNVNVLEQIFQETISDQNKMA